MLRFQTLDVFTTRPFAGNPLAVVEGANGLTTAQMQTIAGEFNLSETIFVQPPENPAHSAKVRIFTPEAELPFAGHPTIGCAVFLAEQVREGDFEVEILLEERAGLVAVQVTRTAGRTEAEFIAPVLPKPTAGTPPDKATAAAALGLAEADIGFGNHTPRAWQAGPEFLFIPLAGRAALRRAKAASGFSEMTAAAKAHGAYLYCRRTAGAGFHARLFAPDIGVTEDPATGSASAILAAQLLASGALPDGSSQIPLVQGEDMGRPGEIGLSVDVAKGAITEIRIRGAAVRIAHGQMRKPPL